MSLRETYHTLGSNLSDFDVRQILINHDKTEVVRREIRVILLSLRAEIYSLDMQEWSTADFENIIRSLVPVDHNTILVTTKYCGYVCVYKNFKEIQKLSIPCSGELSLCNGVVCVNYLKTLELFSLRDGTLSHLNSLGISPMGFHKWSVEALGRNRLLISGDKQAYLTCDLEGKDIKEGFLSAFETEPLIGCRGLVSLLDPLNFRFALANNTAEEEFQILDFSQGHAVKFQTVKGRFGKTLSENTFYVVGGKGEEEQIWTLDESGSRYHHVQDLPIDYSKRLFAIENAFSVGGDVYVQTRWKGFVKEMDLGDKDIRFLFPSSSQTKKLSRRLGEFMEKVPLDVVEIVARFI